MSFVNKYPYTDFHELNIDWLLETVKKHSSSIEELQELVSELKKMTPEEVQQMIDSSIMFNNQTIQGWLNDLHIEINGEMQTKLDALDASIKRYVDNQDQYYDNYAQAYAAGALMQAEQYADAKLTNYLYMYSPITGQYEDVRVVVQEIISYYHGDEILTASEYDALDLTATAYDAYDLTAQQYDLQGKTLLV